jgi:two-component system sensor histidine kinase HydH
LLALGMSSAPGRRELRWFALCAAVAALFNLSNVLVTIRAPLATVLVTSRLSVVLGGFHTAAWFKYAATQERRSLTPIERTIVAVTLVLSVVAMVPGVMLEDHLFTRVVPSLGVTYADAPPTALGKLTLAMQAGGLLFVFLRYLKRRLDGDREHDAQCVALGAVLVGAGHDALESAGVIDGPYILDYALLVMVLAVGGSLTRSFVTNAHALEVSSRNLAAAHEQLVKRERLAALGELAAVVAHEVRNPLAVVFNATAGLRKAAPGSTDHEALIRIVQEEAEHLRDMVTDLLEFARPRPPVFAQIAVDEAVRSAIDAARGEAGAADDDVTFDVERGLSQHSCDERLVRQAVINLVANALHAPERRGPVRVRLQTLVDGDGQKIDGVVISVADDGQGIAPELRERIFTPFFSTRPKGTGLGLAVVRSSAEAHGGDVVLSDTPGGGATFTLRLPGGGEAKT